MIHRPRVLGIPLPFLTGGAVFAHIVQQARALCVLRRAKRGRGIRGPFRDALQVSQKRLILPIFSFVRNIHAVPSKTLLFLSNYSLI